MKQRIEINEIKRMQLLAGIIQENEHQSMTEAFDSKKDVLDYFLNENPYLFYYIASYNSIEDLFNYFGVDSIGGVMDVEYGGSYSEEDIAKLDKYTRAYYQLFKPKEIYVDRLDKNGLSITGGYNNIKLVYLNEDEYLVVGYNL